MRKPVVIVVVLAAALALLVFLWIDWDRRAIMKNLARLERLVSKDKVETTFEALGRARNIGALFAKSPDVHFPPYLPSVTDRQELAALVYQGRGMADTISVRVYDTALTFDAGRRGATLLMTARGTATRGRMEDTDIRELELGWVREDGEWLVKRVRVVSTIQHPTSGL